MPLADRQFGEGDHYLASLWYCTTSDRDFDIVLDRLAEGPGTLPGGTGMEIQRVDGGNELVVDEQLNSLPHEVPKDAPEVGPQFTPDRGDAAVVEPVAPGPHDQCASQG